MLVALSQVTTVPCVSVLPKMQMSVPHTVVTVSPAGLPSRSVTLPLSESTCIGAGVSL